MSRTIRWLLTIVAAAFILLPVGYIGFNYGVTRALEARGLRKLLSGKTGKVLDCDAGYSPLIARGTSVSARGFVGKASPPRALTELRASRLYARCNLSELWHLKWRIDHLWIAHLQAAYGAFAAQQLNRKEFPDPELRPPIREESPLEVDLRRLEVNRLDLGWGTSADAAGEFRDVHTEFFPKDKNLRVEATGGTFRQGKWPQAKLQSVKVFYAKPNLRIDEAVLSLGGSSIINVSGGFVFSEEQSFDLQLTVKECPIAPFLTAEQRSKLDGKFQANARIAKDKSDEHGARSAGTIKIDSAVLKNVDVLKKVADFTGHAEIAQMKVTSATADYDWNFPTLTVRNFAFESRGVATLRGEFVIKDNRLDGEFELGVAPEIVDKFPGAREEVFRRNADGYLWTDLVLSGPPNNLHDNLKGRLVRAVQAHFAKGLLAPIFKPGQTIIEAIEEL